MEAIDIIRLTATEFEDVDDEDIEQWIELAKPFVSSTVFGDAYNQALAYFVCHKMKMSGLGESSLGEIGNVSNGYAIASISAGSSSVSFATNSGDSTDLNGEFMRTQYGLQYVQLMRLFVVPIAIA